MSETAHRQDSGFALLLVFLMAAVIAISLYMQMPRVAFQSQRQKEQLLIERGEQYKRAIQLFVRANGRYPAELKDLENFNNRRFLRHKFADPMTGKTEWRLIHVNAAGVFTDSIANKKKNDKDKQDSASQNSFVGTEAFLNTDTGQNKQGPTAASRRRESEGGAAPVGPDGQPLFPTPVPGAAPGGAAPPQPPGAAFPANVSQVNASGQPVPGFQQNPGERPNQQFPNQGIPGMPVPGAPSQLPANNDPASQGNNPAFPGQPVTPGAPSNPVPNNPPLPGQPQLPGFMQPGGQPGFQPGGQPGAPQNGFTQPGGVAQPGSPLGAANQNASASSSSFVGSNSFVGGSSFVGSSSSGGAPTNPIPQPNQFGQPNFSQPAQNPAFNQPNGQVNQPTQFNNNAGGVPTQTLGGTPQTAGAPTGAAGLINNILTSPRSGGGPTIGQPVTAGTPGQPVTGGTGQTVGAGIAGVASTSEDPAIMVYNDKTNYNEWEFIFDFSKQKPLANPAGTPGTPAAALGSMPGAGLQTPAAGLAGGLPGGLPGGLSGGLNSGAQPGLTSQGAGGIGTSQSPLGGSPVGSTSTGGTGTPGQPAAPGGVAGQQSAIPPGFRFGRP